MNKSTDCTCYQCEYNRAVESTELNLTRDQLIKRIAGLRHTISLHEQELKIYQIMFISGTITPDVYFEQTGLIHETIENYLLETKNILTQYQQIDQNGV